MTAHDDYMDPQSYKSEGSRFDKESSALLPCPCCGYRAGIEQVLYRPDTETQEGNAGGYYIECKRAGCGITTRLAFASKDDPLPVLIASWNRRATGTRSAGVSITDLPTIHDCVNADPRRLEPFYTHWVSALTEQGLHRKSDIAVLLAILSQRANVAQSAIEGRNHGR